MATRKKATPRRRKNQGDTYQYLTNIETRAATNRTGVASGGALGVPVEVRVYPAAPVGKTVYLIGKTKYTSHDKAAAALARKLGVPYKSTIPKRNPKGKRTKNHGPVSTISYGATLNDNDAAPGPWVPAVYKRGHRITPGKHARGFKTQREATAAAKKLAEKEAKRYPGATVRKRNPRKGTAPKKRRAVAKRKAPAKRAKARKKRGTVKRRPNQNPRIHLEYAAVPNENKNKGGWVPMVWLNGKHERGSSWHHKGYDKDVAQKLARAYAREEASRYIGDWDVKVTARKAPTKKKRAMGRKKNPVGKVTGITRRLEAYAKKRGMTGFPVVRRTDEWGLRYVLYRLGERYAAFNTEKKGRAEIDRLVKLYGKTYAAQKNPQGRKKNPPKGPFTKTQERAVTTIARREAKAVMMGAMPNPGFPGGGSYRLSKKGKTYTIRYRSAPGVPYRVVGHVERSRSGKWVAFDRNHLGLAGSWGTQKSAVMVALNDYLGGKRPNPKKAEAGLFTFVTQGGMVNAIRELERMGVPTAHNMFKKLFHGKKAAAGRFAFPAGWRGRVLRVRDKADVARVERAAKKARSDYTLQTGTGRATRKRWKYASPKRAPNKAKAKSRSKVTKAQLATLNDIFKGLIDKAERRKPLITVTKLYVKAGIHDSLRHFAETKGKIVYVAPELLHESKPVITGVLAHELGHVLRNIEAKRALASYDAEERAADKAAEAMTGLRIYYDKRGVETTTRVKGAKRPRPAGLR